MFENAKSVYAYGAEDGLVVGPLMALAIVCMGASTYIPLLFIPAVVLALAVPVFAYKFLARTYKAQPLVSTFSALWLEGICMFFFGSLIMAAVVYLTVRFLKTTFMVDQINTFIDIYGKVDDPQARSMVKMMKTILAEGMIPTPIQIALELVYMAVFSGSLLSMFFALIIRRRK